METTNGKHVFECEGCNKRHPWSSGIAGKVGRCKCGSRMTVPAEPMEPGRAAQIPDEPRQSPVDLYELASASTHGVPDKPIVPTTLESSAFTPSVPRMPTRKGLKPEEPEPPRPQPVWQYLILPIVLVVVGVVLTPLGAAATPDGWKSVGDVAVQSYVGLIAELGFVLTAMLAVSAMGGISFDEPLWRVALKLCAVATLPGPVGLIVQNSMGEVGGAILGNFTQLGLYFGLFVLLFRQALSDTVICVFAIFIIRVLVAYVMYRIQSARMGSSI